MVADRFTGPGQIEPLPDADSETRHFTERAQALGIGLCALRATAGEVGPLAG